MSDLGRLFRLSVAGPKPLENFTSTALATPSRHDQRPMVKALGTKKRQRYKGGPCPVLDHFWRERTARPSIGAEVQKTLFPVGELPIGYLDLGAFCKRHRGPGLCDLGGGEGRRMGTRRPDPGCTLVTLSGCPPSRTLSHSVAR